MMDSLKRKMAHTTAISHGRCGILVVLETRCSRLSMSPTRMVHQPRSSVVNAVEMACEVPFEFWTKTISSLRKDWPQMYMLAEGEDPKLHESGFDASYAWELHHLLNDIAQGKKGIPELLEYVKHDAERFPQDAFRLMFTSNHDENSWAGTEFERMGDAAKVMAVLTFTLPNGQPLIYTGQEIGWNHRFQFFEKDPVPAWEVNEFTQFYQELIKLRHEHPALRPGGKGGRFEVFSAEDSTLVFRRVLGNDVVTVTAQLCSPWNWNLDNK